jgi:hypothetical protein
MTSQKWAGSGSRICSRKGYQICFLIVVTSSRMCAKFRWSACVRHGDLLAADSTKSPACHKERLWRLLRRILHRISSLTVRILYALRLLPIVHWFSDVRHRGSAQNHYCGFRRFTLEQGQWNLQTEARALDDGKPKLFSFTKKVAILLEFLTHSGDRVAASEFLVICLLDGGSMLRISPWTVAAQLFHSFLQTALVLN